MSEFDPWDGNMKQIFNNETKVQQPFKQAAVLRPYSALYDPYSGTWSLTRCTGIPEAGGFVGVNGVKNSVETAAANLGRASLEAGYQQFTLLYNPSDGLLADLAESRLDVFGWGSAAAQQLADMLQAPLRNGVTVMLVGHSQGGAIVNMGLSRLAAAGVKASRLTVCAFGAPIPRQSFADNVARVNATLGYFKVNDFDAVATLIGRNAIGPRSVLGSIVRVPLLFTKTFSAHGSYNYFP
jgi:Lipase (class 3)